MGRAVGIGVIFLILSLLTGAGDEHDAGGAGDGRHALIDRGVVFIDLAVAAQHRACCAGLFGAGGFDQDLHLGAAHPRRGGIVDGEGGEALLRRHRVDDPFGAAAGGELTVDRVQIGVAKGDYGAALCQREKAVVFQKDAALLGNALCHGIGRLGGFVSVCVGNGIVVRVHTLGVLGGGDRLFPRAHIGVDGGGHNGGCRVEDQQQHQEDRQAGDEDPPEGPVGHLQFFLFHGFRSFLLIL